MSPSRNLLLALTAAATLVPSAFAADKWTVPTPEELKLTSVPEAPGAAAIILNEDEVTDDKNHSYTRYVRYKVLTEEGRKFGDVELAFRKGSEGFAYTVDTIEGRTIHPDGTIIPFTGKPYDKMIEQAKGQKHMAKIFTMPDVQVGSIIEVRYIERWDDNWFMIPQWYLQDNLYKRKLHFTWRPSNKEMHFSDGKSNQRIEWTPILPAGVELKMTRLPGAGIDAGQIIYEVSMDNVRPLYDEEYMAPINSLSFRVLFYYNNATTFAEFWKNEGKDWSKKMDHFIGSSDAVRSATQTIIAGSTMPDEKLKKIYAAVMTMENTDYTHERTQAENKAAGLKEIKTAEGVLQHKSGSSDDLALLFVAMARSAGLKAYAAGVADRNQRVFIPQFMSLSQLDDIIAVVNVDGKDIYLDPGQKFCPYGHLFWKHSDTEAMRQLDGGATSLVITPPEGFKDNRNARIADLKIDATGHAEGTIHLTFNGQRAIELRQRQARTDVTAFRHYLKEEVEHLLPEGGEASVTVVDYPTDGEKPLDIFLHYQGPIANATGKRLIVTGDLFESHAKPAFPHPQRETPVYFHYASQTNDVVRLTFPAGLAIESAPDQMSTKYLSSIGYGYRSERAPTSVTIRRDFVRGDILFESKEYSAFREFWGKTETKDQESVVFSVAQTSASN